MEVLNCCEDYASAATLLKALGDPTRLQIYMFLRDQCSKVVIEDGGAVRPVQGMTVGQVCCHVTGLEKVSSTISFHLKELRINGLIDMEKQGRFMVCSVNQESMAKLAQLFQTQQTNKPEDQEACCE